MVSDFSLKMLFYGGFFGFKYVLFFSEIKLLRHLIYSFILEGYLMNIANWLKPSLAE